MVYRKDVTKFIAENNDLVVETEVRPFGTRSAHVTLPAKWLGEKVRVRIVKDSEIV